MRALILLTIGAVAFAGCASHPPSPSWRPASPPAVEGVAAEYGNGGPCSYAQEHGIDAYAPADADPRPRAVRRCIPIFPLDLQRRGYEADCLVRFHVNENGRAATPAAECDVWSDAAQAPEWDAFARAAFTRLAEMSVEHSLYPAGPEADASKPYARRVSFRLQ